MLKKIMPKALVLLSGLVVLSCEPEVDRLGEQFFPKTDVEEAHYDIVGYNINNKDTLRADNLELGNLMLGAFREQVFGTQKAAFVSQVRLENYAPDFGENPAVDSAVLVLKPLYDVRKPDEYEDGDYVFPDGDVAAKKKVISYPVHKYGKETLPNGEFTINVQEVTDYLGMVSSPKFSNKVVGLNPTLIGTKKFKGTVNEVNITKDEDNSTLYSHDASLRIPLDKAFIQSKIIDKEGTSVLADAASFIRHFRGVRVSVEENDGYLMSLDYSAMHIMVYYKNDKTENGTTTRVRQNFKMSLGAGNVRFGQYEYDRAGSAVATAMSNTNTVSGDKQLYLQGMGGPSVGLRVPASAISDLKQKFQNDKVGIMGAKIRLYLDGSWENDYELPAHFVFYQKKKNDFIPDMKVFSSIEGFSIFAFQNKTPKYYDIVVTETLKRIVEKEAKNQDFILEIGNWRVNTQTGQLYGFQYDTRAYTPHRMVFTGTQPGNDKKVQLIVTYAKN